MESVKPYTRLRWISETLPRPARPTPRAAEACLRCRKMKAKCSRIDHNETCKRCAAAGELCTFKSKLFNRSKRTGHRDVKTKLDSDARRPKEEPIEPSPS